ncbi:Bile acid 7-dehydroxylase 2 [Enhygromyxa salina]|uniref:Bile acid 7-dehydroxylase 2 n=1 Tax=Enhygromyxa salina TaxID=215803 RepID=A0A2S9XEM7_9BACT|nr:SDR family oxidoreductase [Enhygromyxa salina]PRP91210.1 Bile acid 7-dehydroxylase 2 [Enhygromyxa salina]
MRSRPSILITGAARGIGRACAERFAAADWLVGLYDIEARELADTAGELSARHGTDRVCHCALDVRDPDSVVAAVAHFAEHSGGRMKVLLNNAGVMSVGRFETVSAADHRRTIAVNLQGLVELTLASFELLRDTPGARVLNMSSAAALYGVPEMASYSATKHAVRGLSEALELEWASHDIRVCDVMPAFVDTELLSGTRRLRAEAALGVRLQPEDVAAVVWQAATARRRRTHWPVGAQMKLAYGADKLIPERLHRLALKWMTKV